jgi:hypothetical protein
MHEVVSQLDTAEEFRWLSPEVLSLHDFLVEHISTLQVVVEAHDASAPSLAQVSIAMAQAPLSPQAGVDLVGCSGAAAQTSHAPLVLDSGSVVKLSCFWSCGRVVELLPQQWLKPPWEALSENSCTCSSLSAMPP